MFSTARRLTVRIEVIGNFAAEGSVVLEAPPGFEPGMEVLQTSALPLGDGAAQAGS